MIKMEKKDIKNGSLFLSEKCILRIILIFSISLRLFILWQEKNSLSIESDDLNYIYGGINFLRTGQITHGMYGASQHAMLIMPGFPIILGIIFSIINYTQHGLVLARLFFVLLGSLSIIASFKIAKKLFNSSIALVTSLIMAISPIVIQYDLMFLTESTFTFFLLWFVYYMLKFIETKRNEDFILLLIFYLFGLLVRTTIALLPFMFILYAYNKKFPLKELIYKGIYAVVLICIVLTPWWVRNYKVTGKFIPTNAGHGDALLAGTYYGNAPETEYTLYDTQVLFSDPQSNNIMYDRMEKQAEYAKERINIWKNENKKDFYFTYLVRKPYTAWYYVNYPLEIYGVLRPYLQKIYTASNVIALLGIVIGLIKKKSRQAILLCTLILFYNTVFSAVTIPIARYNFPIMPFYYMLFSYCLLEMKNLSIFFWKKIKKETKMQVCFLKKD